MRQFTMDHQGSDDWDECGMRREWNLTQTELFQQFATSARSDELGLRFWKAPQAVYNTIECLWDTTLAARQFNWECVDDGGVLYEGPTDLIRRRFHKTTALMVPHIYSPDVADKYRFLWVIDRWLSGISLTPPCLQFLPNGKLGVRDGFHRLAVAAIAGIERMPFWGLGPCVFHEITLSYPDGAST